jgi:serine/threonine protein kinase
MPTICPNYQCSQRHQQSDLDVCANCGTSITFGGKYKLTKIIRTSPEKIDSPAFSWYEIFECRSNRNTNLVIKFLIVDHEALQIRSNVAAIQKIQRQFEREYRLLRKGLEGVCRGYAILDVPITNGANQTIADGSVSLRAIVMEKVPGINLDQYVIRHGAIDSKKALTWLKQLVKTLDSMHRSQLLHRDIKPSNIMISGDSFNERLTLIDLGVSLDKLNIQVGDETDAVGTHPYKDPLYEDGSPYLNNSDFYSLGQTFIYLLTGKPPSSNGLDDQNAFSLPLKIELKNAIQQMTSSDPNCRFVSSKQLLQSLGNHRWLKWLTFAILVIVGFISAFILSPPKNEYSYVHPICEAPEVNCGDKKPILFSGSNDEKFKQYFKNLSDSNKDTREAAIDQYRESWKSYKDEEFKSGASDPTGELLIYLNNAQVQGHMKNSDEIFTLLVIIPKPIKGIDISANILSGVSQSQKEFNEKLGAKKLYIAILEEIDDKSNTRLKEIITSKLSQPKVNHLNNYLNDYLSLDSYSTGSRKSKFIGIMGHYASKFAFSMLKTYAENNILLISPGASQSKLSENTPAQLEYFARTIGNRKNRTHKITNWIQKLAEGENNCGLLDISLIYQKEDPSSEELHDEMIKEFTLTGGEQDKPQKYPNNTRESILLNKIRIKSIGYTFDKKTDKLEQKILSELKENLASVKGINGCIPKQVIVFYMGPHVVDTQRKVITSIANEVTGDINFVSNIPFSLLNSRKIRDDIEKDNPGFYGKAYEVVPYHILDFTPAYYSPEKARLNVKFITDMQKNSIATIDSDILDIDWRQISSADAISVFTTAIETIPFHQNRKSTDKCRSELSATDARIIRDIVKCSDFKANGISGEIAFDGYEPKHTKSGTILKYITDKNRGGNDKSRKNIQIPIDYLDLRNPKLNQSQPFGVEVLGK